MGNMVHQALEKLYKNKKFKQQDISLDFSKILFRIMGRKIY